MIRPLVILVVSVSALVAAGCGLDGSAGAGPGTSTGTDNLGQNAAQAPNCVGLWAQCQGGVAGTCAEWEAGCRDGAGACPDLNRSCQAQHDATVCGQYEAECRSGVTPPPADAGSPPTNPACAQLLTECHAGDHSMCERYEQLCR